MVTLLQTIDTSHEDMIHDAQMDYYGIRLATCSSDKSIRIFDVVNGAAYKLVATLTGHDGPVWQIAWGHPMYGSLLASCSYDRSVIIWKENNGVWEKLYVYNDHDSSVNSVCWAPHQFGLILACGSSDGAVSVLSSLHDGRWSPKKINNAHTIGCNAVSWEPAIAFRSILDPPLTETSSQDTPKRFVSGGCDNLVKIWKFNEDEEWIEDQKLEGHSDWVRDVAWAPSIGLVPRSMIASCSQDRRVIIWNLDEESKWIPKILSVFDDVVWHVSWSVTGTILAVSGGDNKVSLWKESLDGHWACINEVNKGQGASKQETKPEELEFKDSKKDNNFFDLNSRPGGHSQSSDVNIQPVNIKEKLSASMSNIVG